MNLSKKALILLVSCFVHVRYALTESGYKLEFQIAVSIDHNINKGNITRSEFVILGWITPVLCYWDSRGMGY